MEESWENWVSHMEMEEDNFFSQGHIINSSNDPKEISQQLQVLCHQTEQSHYPYPSSTLVEACNTNFQSSIHHVQNNPSTIIVDTTCFHTQNSKEGAENTLSTHILPLINSTLQPPISSNMKHDSNLGSFKKTQVNHSLKPRTTKKVRSSSEIAEHIVAERKRRLKLTQNFIALSAIIPGLKKTDKSYILEEAINYVNQLQERVRELETENQKINAYSAILDRKLLLSMNEDSNTCETNNIAGYRSTEALPEVRVRVSEKSVLIAIHCEKQNDIVHKILNLLTKLHLSISSSSVLQFGASTLKITIIAQMEDDHNMGIDDLVKSLRKELMKSQEGPQ